MTEPKTRSFLLRLWRDHPGAPWRATLIDGTQPEERRHFATLDALYTFLCAQVGEGSGANDERDTAYCTPSESR
jgi:hypothetical protein